MAVTRLDVETRIRAFFENDNYYSTNDILASIQDGYDETVAFSGCILKSVSLPFEANKTYYDLLTLIPDYLGVFAIFNHAIKRWMIPSSLKKFNLDRPDWEVSLGVPFFFSVISHRWMAIYKKPGAADYGNMDIFYIAQAPTLVDNTTEIQMPDDHVTALYEYIETDLWEQNQEWTKAGNHFASYISKSQDLREWAKNTRMQDRIPGLK